MNRHANHDSSADHQDDFLVESKLKVRLTDDLKRMASETGYTEITHVVDAYYRMQRYRLGLNNQSKAADRNKQPHALLDWMHLYQSGIESGVKAMMAIFTDRYTVGRWLQSQYGIGPVLSAGFMANFDIRRAETCGHFWAYAGLNPQRVWISSDRAGQIVTEIKGKDLSAEKIEEIVAETGIHGSKIINAWENGCEYSGKKYKPGKEALKRILSQCPYNRELKSFCLARMGDVMIKFSKRDECFYGKLYRMHKEDLLRKNESGEFAETAKREMERNPRMNKTERWKYWQQGQLAPGHINDRARRWMVKLFLSHLHEVMWRDYYGTDPPAPYVFSLPGHHKIDVPKWPVDNPGRSLKEMYERGTIQR